MNPGVFVALPRQLLGVRATLVFSSGRITIRASGMYAAPPVATQRRTSRGDTTRG
jgi:hypothetical protein